MTYFQIKTILQKKNLNKNFKKINNKYKITYHLRLQKCYQD